MTHYVRESVIETHLKRVAKNHDIECHKFQWIGRRNAPDRILLFPSPDLVFVECKAPKGVLSDAQRREHHRLRVLGYRIEVFWTKKQIDQYFLMRSVR